MLDTKTIQQLDLNLLKVFETLYLERNMTLVAKSLFISPSAVSHAIKRLRTALSDDLFIRQGSQMQPTTACERMAPQLIETLNQLRRILQSCGEFSLSSSKQTFKLAMPEALEPLVLTKIYQRITAQAPKIKITSVKLSRHEMSRHLATKQIDVAIDIALPKKLPIKHLELSSDEYCVLMSKHHNSGGSLSTEQYLNCPHVSVSSRATGKVLEDFAILELGENREIDVRCQSYSTAKEFLKGSNYLLTLPGILARQLVDDTLMICRMPIPLPPVKTHLYWHQNTEDDEAIAWLRDQIRLAF
ncbi:LysR family transcriptional regulator [Psychrosphaera haliotis]|uniref:LysR family transcriptional regulator n=1 Tax=Psychrosphaera haliotis TaxID=555083 RepID=A0A6N8FCR2_9GAMM|nr:LysR family transcriptional regulator [Psychrosphaera haliotis]MUH72957.1 LysR family transcriptional regulator [Psychrosphaera haliotis]